MRNLAVFAIVALSLACAVGAPTFGADAKSELSFSGALSNPNDGGSSWSATGEYLIAVGGAFLLGPSVSLFDAPGADGGSFGLAGELNAGKTSGLFFGGAVSKLTGDLGNLADYAAQARAGLKFGSGTGGVKIYAARTWTRGETGEVSAPDSTDVVAGLILRF